MGDLGWVDLDMVDMRVIVVGVVELEVIGLVVGVSGRGSFKRGGGGG